jgi:transcriptional regulator with XRE-family HTH domain
VNIGEKIKNLRLKNGLTQEELADRCELSKGFISLVEHNQTSPSITTLGDILDALGTDFAKFFKEDIPERVVFGKKDFSVKTDEELKNEICWLIPTAQKFEMEPIMVTIEPGGSTYPDNPHEGEEFGYVIEGTVTVVIGDEEYLAKKGESFYFIANKPHMLENRGAKQAKAIWISAPPSF